MLRLLIIATMTLSTQALADEPVSCSWEQHLGDGATRSGGLAIYLKSGGASRLVIESASASGHEGGGYLCSYDSASAEYKTGRDSILGGVRFSSDIADPKPTFKVIKKQGRYFVTIENGSWHCGFGAQFPAVELTPGDKACKVTYQ